MTNPEEYMLPCLNKALLGIECTGCGAQRSLVLLFNGQFEQAFFMYPAIYTILILLVFLLFNLFYKFKQDYVIKIGLVILNAGIIGIAYIIKMSQLLT